MAAPDPRFRDVEILLRSLALAANWRNYGKPMKTFITNYMEVLDKSDSDQLQFIKERFVNACSFVRSQLGEKPFHLRQRLNLAAFDSVMACSIESLDLLIPNIQDAFQELLEDEEFKDTVTYNTSDTSVIHQRFELTRGAFIS